ncbi:MAG: metallophosphoesterase, partial [Pseudomonadota bacterium]|nr:metallophosphoesterase [Pseudomonadota bacterium]
MTQDNDNLVIAQVTDIHISPTEATYRDINVRQQFLDVVDTLASKPLDLLVLSGDLAAYSGEIEAYLWIKQALTLLPYPYVVMAGNHDNVAHLSKVFELSQDDRLADGSLCFSRIVRQRRLLFLDSSPNQVSKAQLDWLHAQLSREQQPVLVFIHHPPWRCGCQFMDKCYPLENRETVWPILAQFPSIQHIFCGHYHTEKTVIHQGKSIHITPATTFQINPDTADFMIAHTRP